MRRGSVRPTCRFSFLSQLGRGGLPALLAILLLGSGAGPVLAAASDSFISGKAFEDRNSDGLYTSGEAAMDNVVVTLERVGETQQWQTQTGTSGEYTFTRLGAGTYRLKAEKPGGHQSNGYLEIKLDGKNGTRSADIGLMSRAPAVVAAPAAPAVPASPAPAPPPQAAPAPMPPPAQQAASLAPIRSARFLLEGKSDDNGQLNHFTGSGSTLHPGELDMRLNINGEELEVVIVGQSSYRRGALDELWRPLEASTLARWHGVLSVLELMALSNTPSRVRLGLSTWAELDGERVRHYELEVVPTQQAAGRSSSRLEAMTGNVELWVGVPDNLIRVAHLQLAFPSSRREETGRMEPANVDAWLRLKEHNTAFTINEPLAIAPPPAPPAPAPAQPAAVSKPAPQPAAAPGPAPAPARAPSDASPSQVRPADPAPQEPISQPVAAETSPERSAAAERALQALESASGPRQGSRAEPGTVVLAVPWRGVLVDPARAAPTTDGLASLAMVLEAFGVTVGTADLQSLAETWQEASDPSETVRLSTLTRIGERGSLRPLGPARGVGGGNWTAALARDYLGRGYPVIALVRSSFLPGGSTEGAQSDRYVTLVGFEGDELLYHDPATPDGLERRVKPAELDKGWASATPPRQGIALGFGASVIGLLNGSAEVKAEATSVPAEVALPPADPKPQPQVSVQEAGQGLPGGIHPALVGFLTLLAGGLGFVVSRLAR
jgi:hypothetical protein